jgi:hypothetical protein
MYCPKCKTEYQPAFTRCKECGAGLVSALPAAVVSETAPQTSGDIPVVLWCGQDPIAFSVVLAALDAAEMPYRETQRRDFTAALSQPVANGFYGLPYWEVRVHPANLERARGIMETALRPLTIVATEPRVESKSRGAAVPHDEFADSAENFRPPVRVWSGKGVTRAQVLRNALVREHIPCWALSAFLGKVRLLVPPDDARRAEEIIREALKRNPAA